MRWNLAESDDGVAASLSKSAGLHPLIAKLMVNRGIVDVAGAQSFLACDLSALSDPQIFCHMEKAVSRILKAISNGHQITVYGDYDVDGVTGTSLLYLVLKRLGAQVHYYIPNRLTEGYGLNRQALEEIRAAGTTLVISVDCGITSTSEATLARSIGLDLIITDHHELGASSRLHSVHDSHDVKDVALPDAHAVLHPWLLKPGVAPGVQDRVSGLTGVGIAFKLAQALLNVDAGDDCLKSYLDLVTLGTVADMGKITGENRILVKHGLDLLSDDSEKQRPGILALKQVAGLNGKRIGVGMVGFSLAPRINASGRLEHANTAFRLLTTSSKDEAMSLAAALDTVNRERQEIEEIIWDAARQQCRKADMAVVGALVLSSQEWHPGVVGIVASRIVEEFYRPTALICLNGGIGKGSARSIPGFDLYEGLVACSDLLLGFGGHKFAAGFSILEDNIPEFRDRLGSIVMERIGASGFIRTLSIDSKVTLEELNRDLVQELDKLSPYGQGNPEPRLGARDIEIIASRVVGNNHLKLRLRQRGGACFDAIAFKRGNLLGKQVKDGMRVAAVFTPRINAWNGNSAVELEIRDMKNEKPV